MIAATILLLCITLSLRARFRAELAEARAITSFRKIRDDIIFRLAEGDSSDRDELLRLARLCEAMSDDIEWFNPFTFAVSAGLPWRREARARVPAPVSMSPAVRRHMLQFGSAVMTYMHCRNPLVWWLVANYAGIGSAGDTASLIRLTTLGGPTRFAHAS